MSACRDALVASRCEFMEGSGSAPKPDRPLAEQAPSPAAMQVEGIETTTNPLFWDFFIAQHTERMRVGQLGMNLTAVNPIQLAENLAMLDHFTGGRMFAGFSRARRCSTTLAGCATRSASTSSSSGTTWGGLSRNRRWRCSTNSPKA